MNKNKKKLYITSNSEKNNIKLHALKIIKKSKHFNFFKINLHNYSAINKYQGFTSFDKYHNIKNYESDSKLSFNMTYVCLFISTCLLRNYGDDSSEFENDLENMIYNINYIKKYHLSNIFCEIKYFLLAYKILCQPNKKIKKQIDIEYWMCDIDTQNPKQEWYSYYLPVNLDDESDNYPKNDDIEKARKKIR